MTRTKRVLGKSRIFSISDKYNSHSKTSHSKKAYSVVFEWQRIIQYTSFFSLAKVLPWNSLNLSRLSTPVGISLRSTSARIRVESGTQISKHWFQDTNINNQGYSKYSSFRRPRVSRLVDLFLEVQEKRNHCLL